MAGRALASRPGLISPSFVGSIPTPATKVNKYRAVKRYGRKVDEHRAVWEDHFGPIPKGYEIHHRNAIKDDNRIENLQLLTTLEHRRLHAKPKSVCSIEGCERFVEGRGWCKLHWYRWRRTGDPLGIKGPGGRKAR